MTHTNYRTGRGAAVTEFAIAMPVLFLLFIGVVDFGRVFYTAITVSHAARAGVQYGAESNGASGDFAGMQQAALAAASDVSGVTASAGRWCRCADGTGSCDCTPGTDGCTVASGCLASCPLDAPQVYVCVTADRVFTTLLSYPGIPNTTDLNRRATMRVQ